MVGNACEKRRENKGKKRNRKIRGSMETGG
jgi:hypothetical protein